MTKQMVKFLLRSTLAVNTPELVLPQPVNHTL